MLKLDVILICLLVIKFIQCTQIQNLKWCSGLYNNDSVQFCDHFGFRIVREEVHLKKNPQTVWNWRIQKKKTEIKVQKPLLTIRDRPYTFAECVQAVDKLKNSNMTFYFEVFTNEALEYVKDDMKNLKNYNRFRIGGNILKGIDGRDPMENDIDGWTAMLQELPEKVGIFIGFIPFNGVRPQPIPYSPLSLHKLDRFVHLMAGKNRPMSLIMDILPASLTKGLTKRMTNFQEIILIGNDGKKMKHLVDFKQLKELTHNYSAKEFVFVLDRTLFDEIKADFMPPKLKTNMAGKAPFPFSLTMILAIGLASLFVF